MAVAVAEGLGLRVEWGLHAFVGVFPLNGVRVLVFFPLVCVTRTVWNSNSHVGVYMLSYGSDLKTSGYGLMFASHRDGEDGVSRDNDKLDC